MHRREGDGEENPKSSLIFLSDADLLLQLQLLLLPEPAPSASGSPFALASWS